MNTEAPLPTTGRPHWSEEIGNIISTLGRHRQILVASDFDGTLSPIVERPEEAVLSPAIRPVLDDLAGAHPEFRLAFLSGRSLEDLTRRIETGGKPVFAGNHGLQIQGSGMDWTHPAVAAARPHLERLLVDLDHWFSGVPGIEIEDKGLSVTLHHRRMIPEWLPLLNEALDSISLPGELRRHEGKMVHEFRPAVDWNKGRAMLRIASHLGIPAGAVVFLGDDATDEDAFRELGVSSTSVHVGDEFKPSFARFNARSPEDVADFLRAIAEARRK